MLVNNYRPVSILPLFSKVLERIMCNRLVSFLEKFKILYKYQFGFRAKHGTNIALNILVDKITQSLQEGNLVLGVFLDFRKAFDTVNHTILLDKLYSYGVRGAPHKWFQSYLSDRKQFVYCNDTSSNLLNITCGVPQGSILGPILFLLYINDIANVSKVLLPIIFADDTNVFLSGKKIPDLIQIMNNELGKLLQWLHVNKLSLNIGKTYFMVFSFNKSVAHKENVEIDGIVIKRVSCTKFLGVMLDEHLTWRDHVNLIKGKISRGIGILYCARKLFKGSTLITMYTTFIHPYMNYCIDIWGAANKGLLESIFKLQKKAIRLITSSKFNAHTSPLFESLKILKLEDIYKYCIALLMFKLHNGMLPDVFNEMFTRNTQIHNYLTRQAESLHVPSTTTHKVASTIRYKGVNLWNEVNKKVNTCCKISVFKNAVKCLLLRHAI